MRRRSERRDFGRNHFLSGIALHTILEVEGFSAEIEPPDAFINGLILNPNEFSAESQPSEL